MLPYAFRAAALVLMLALTACPSPVDRGGEPAASGAQPATLDPLPGETAYAVSGPHGLTATLRYAEQAAEWTLDGHFTVPTGGYRVPAASIEVMESMPEQVRVVLTVIPPPDDAMVTQVVTDLPVNERVEASAEARFEIFVVESGEPHAAP